MSDSAWRNIFYVLCVAFLGLFGYFVLNGKDGQVITLIASFVCLLASRFNDVVKFKFSGSGLEGEMREVLQEARATVSQLHLIAEELSKNILWSMQAHGRMGGTSPESQHEMRNKVIATLEALGVAKERIAHVVAVEYPYIDFDYAHYVTRPLNMKVQDEDRIKWSEFFSSKKRKGIGFEPKPEELEKFLESVNLLDAETTERLEDYKYFLKHRKHRRPNEWDKRFERD
ncbi:MAG: hypothetical protein E5X74_18750 [Mesorhizobium sp.]|uniref:hypothetical protein n=1 Tax=Mesorhizobium sp. TaxID=1871066 RepID=UPI0012126276|nr:hypothetical protein [Mesorhizobium sp.]TIO74442.1 MAG: hypothetical protein E5X75_23945 [Mesorhizobium sp.]TIO83774.1 MAG: hypothetical protein E5X74_18750 [Mesorhizobium sp.]